MSPVTIYSLVASLVLAASLVAVLRVLPWHHLVLVGVVGTYINQWRWTAEVAVPWTSVEISSAAASQDFWLSTAIVVMYWVLFVVTSFVRRPVSQKERDIHFITNLLNTVGMLGLIAWQTWQYHHGQLYYLTAPASIRLCLRCISGQKVRAAVAVLVQCDNCSGPVRRQPATGIDGR